MAQRIFRTEVAAPELVIDHDDIGRLLCVCLPKSRPAKRGIPSDWKYRGVTTQYSVKGSATLAIAGRPSIVKLSVVSVPENGNPAVADTEATPGTAADRSKISE